jgi:hypothetical protein
MATHSLDSEPDLVSVGVNCVAAATANTAAYYMIFPGVKLQNSALDYEYSKLYEIQELQFGKTFQKTYPTNVTKLMVNDKFAVVLLQDETIHVHPVNEEYFASSGQALILPENDQKITCATLTNSFLVYATSSGQIVHYELEDLTLINTYQHSVLYIDFRLALNPCIISLVLV